LCGPPLFVASLGFWVRSFFYGGFVGEDGGGVDVGGGDARIALEDEPSLFERAAAVPVVARDAGGLDEGGYGVGEIGDCANEALDLEIRGEFRPALEAVLAGEDELSVGESEAGGGHFVEGELVEPGVEAPDEVNRVRVRCVMGVEEVLGLFFVLFEAGAGW
jgi:hypothetical protein